MISYIQGNITSKSPTHVIIESGGLGYHVNISLNTYSKIQEKTQCRLHTYLHLGGGLQGPASISLFGFYEETEREIFMQLLSVSGIGTATVRVILSSMSPEEMQRAIATENVTLLESIKGIGPKTARRMILELKDKIGKQMSAMPAGTGSHNKVKEDALGALVMLGFSRLQAEHSLKKLLAQNNKEWNVEELVKETLRMI